MTHLGASLLPSAPRLTMLRSAHHRESSNLLGSGGAGRALRRP
jgi:hypothetical protein